MTSIPDQLSSNTACRSCSAKSTRDGRRTCSCAAGWHSLRVARPRRAGQIKPERVRVLPEPVDVHCSGERRLHVEVLRLENERVRRGCDEHLAFSRARNVERVRRGVVH